MNKKIGILYLCAALLFTQPVVQAINLNQIANFDAVKSYITQENCVKATFVTALVAFVVYALWKIQGNSSAQSIKMKDHYKNKNPLSDKKTRQLILAYVNNLFKRRNSLDSEIIENTMDDIQHTCESMSHNFNDDVFLILKNEFASALKQEDECRELRIQTTYKDLCRFLNPEGHEKEMN